eukprot:5254107-Amphidinium_carterae.1
MPLMPSTNSFRETSTSTAIHQWVSGAKRCFPTLAEQPQCCVRLISLQAELEAGPVSLEAGLRKSFGEFGEELQLMTRSAQREPKRQMRMSVYVSQDPSPICVREEAVVTVHDVNPGRVFRGRETSRIGSLSTGR